MLLRHNSKRLKKGKGFFGHSKGIAIYIICTYFLSRYYPICDIELIKSIKLFIMFSKMSIFQMPIFNSNSYVFDLRKEILIHTWNLMSRGRFTTMYAAYFDWLYYYYMPSRIAPLHNNKVSVHPDDLFLHVRIARSIARLSSCESGRISDDGQGANKTATVAAKCVKSSCCTSHIKCYYLKQCMYIPEILIYFI